jgi:hypothetical protein
MKRLLLYYHRNDKANYVKDGLYITSKNFRFSGGSINTMGFIKANNIVGIITVTMLYNGRRLIESSRTNVRDISTSRIYCLYEISSQSEVGIKYVNSDLFETRIRHFLNTGCQFCSGVVESDLCPSSLNGVYYDPKRRNRHMCEK